MSSNQPTLLPARDEAAIRSALESMLLVAGGSVAVTTLATAIGIGRLETLRALENLRHDLDGGIRLQLHDEKAQLVTAPENVEIVHRFLGTQRPPGLSRAALEVLTVVAYRQPSTRAEIESVRGVNSDRAVQTLLARELIEECGQRPTIGRPMQYRTTFGFLEYFGLSSLEDLPPLEDEPGTVVDPQAVGMRLVPPRA